MTSTSKVRLITTYSQFELAMSDSSGIVVILYTAPGCPHCNNFLPKFNSLSIEREANNVSFYNVNLMSGDGMAIARKNNVRPSILLLCAAVFSYQMRTSKHAYKPARQHMHACTCTIAYLDENACICSTHEILQVQSDLPPRDVRSASACICKICRFADTSGRTTI